MTSLSQIEQDIVDEGAKVLALARKGALEARKLNLVAELEKIEADLAALLGKSVPAAEKAAPPTKADLKEAAADAGVATTGTKDEIAARIEEAAAPPEVDSPEK